MADTPFISQEVIEAAADEGTASVSQAVLEAGADNATVSISQSVLEAGADNAAVFISQVVIEYSPGVEVPPEPPEPRTETFVFDEGGGVEYWIVPQLTDSGIELRDKVIKAVRVTGKITNADAKIYGYGPTDPVVVSDLEDGINSSTGAVPLADTAQVAQGQRWQVNVPNAMLHTIRVAGTWDGNSPRDRIDEMEYEIAQSGVRR